MKARNQLEGLGVGGCTAMEPLINIWSSTELLCYCFKPLIWPHYWSTVHARDVQANFSMVIYLVCVLFYAI